MKWIKELFSIMQQKRTKVWLMTAFLFSLFSLEAQNVANYQLDKLDDNLFQVSIVPDTTYTGLNNRVSNMQVVVRVRTGGFELANLTNSINTGLSNEVIFTNSSRNDAPADNPQYDYLSFTLFSGATTEIPFVDGDAVPLFTFQNSGTCSQDSIYLLPPDDSFHFPNTIGANTQHQLSILGYGGADAPVGNTGSNVADCIDNCVAQFEIERMTNGTFQVSLTPRETYDGTGDNNRISNLQVTIRVKSDGFEAGNLINLINTGLGNEVTFDQTGRFDAPGENPNYDYISFSLQNISTTDIPFVDGQKVPLFTFNNVGLCTEDTVSLITLDDPFYPPNMDSHNSDLQLTILGYGMSDAPVCVIGNPAEDCTRDCVLGCNDNVQISLGINCEAEVRPEMVATALSLTCPNGPKGVEISENGVVIPTSPFLNESHIGRTFQVRIIDSITTNSCWGSIIVKDKAPPVILCSDDTLNCATQDVSPDNPLLGYPIVFDYCTDSITNLSYSDRYILNGCGTEFSGRLERTWTATDSAGMVGTCLQNVYFIRQPLDSVVFPLNRDGIEGPIVTCTDGATDPSNVGAPTIDGEAVYPNLIGVCQIDAGFRDDSVSFCEGNLQVIRTWTVVDGCTGAFRTDIQIISVQDTTPPMLICPDTIRGSVDLGICSGTVDFPAATVSDECSGARVNISTPFGFIDGNGGTLSWIPVGYHPITYTAIDSCNNQISCTTILHMEDRTPPVAACDYINDVSLRPNGTVDVYAAAFDDGSRDGCSGDQLTFLVQRVGDTLDFADFVTFYCTDAGDTVDVNLRVTDLSGNIDECVAAIVITGDSPPQITCPADQIIQCTDDISDLSIFGNPTVLDDCGGLTAYTETDSFELNTCGVGRIIRTFSINYGGNIISCDQILTVQNNSTFDGTTIVWPADYQTLACGNEPLHPDSLPGGFNVPSYDSTGSLCNRILRYYNDATFDDVTDPVGCYTILRKWEIIDWCVFNANDTLAGGYWTNTQQIDLVNSAPPTFTNCPASVQISVTDNSCAANVPLVFTATDDCTPDSLLTYTYAIDLDDDGSVDSIGNTNDATGIYQVGIHSILFTVRDDCGNTETCNFWLTVRDSTLPNIVCNTDTFNFEDVGGQLRAVVIPRQLALNSTDDCSVFDSLIITANPSEFTCNEEGLNQVLVTVTDEAGNSDSCLVDVFISDTNNRCPINRTAVNISGIITNEMGERVDRVEVSINHPDVPISMTNEMGEFNLVDVPVGNDYTILPSRDFDILNGISTFDLVLISRHILGLEPIKSPYRMIAADVNRSGSITAYDIVHLRKLILRLSKEFPNNTSWRFVRTDFDFKNAEDPNKDYFPEVYNINDLPKSDMNIEGFVAVKVGDVNNSASTQSAFVEGESRTAANTLKLTMKEQQLLEGSTVEIPVTAMNFDQLLGFQFAMDFNPNSLELLAVNPSKNSPLTTTNFGQQFIQKGILTTSWEQATIQAEQLEQSTLFNLQFKVKETGNLSEVLSLNYDWMKAEAYAAEKEAIELLNVSLLFENKEQTTGFKLYQNKPNPFSENAIISFDLPSAEQVNLNILDITGKMVQQIQYDGNKGYNEWIISSKDLEGKGVYYYQLATAKGVKTKKMILIE